MSTPRDREQKFWAFHLPVCCYQRNITMPSTVIFASLISFSIQFVFSNFYLGIALGAIDFATKYTTSKTRAWPYGGDNKEMAMDEFYILST